MKSIDKNKKSLSNNCFSKNTFYLYEKANRRNSIRVLYKQLEKSPRVRIIPNIQLLKRAIIAHELDIIPYQNVFLICNNQEYMKTTPINVIFDFFHISGDVLVVKINKERREFESLSQEDIIWFTNDLIYRSFNHKVARNKIKSNVTNIEDYLPKKPKEIVEEYSSNFETSLIQTLTNIELTLASLLSKKNSN